MSTPNVVRFDWAAFAARLERLRAEHAVRTPEQGVAASAAAFQRWGVAPPPSFVEAHAATVRCGGPRVVTEG